MTKIKWEEPPLANNTNKKRTRWSDVAEQLRAKPGSWALVSEAVKYSVTTTYINKGRITAFEPAGAYEATSRKRPDGSFDVYARYVGE